MDSETIRTALGRLQVDPDSEDAWSTLKEAALSPERDLSLKDLLHLMDRAREKHRERGEWDAVAALLEIETQVAAGSNEEPDLYRQLARVLSDELFDDASAAAAYRKFLELEPSDEAAAAALEESEGKRKKYHELVETYLAEAEQAPDEVYRSSMLMRAAEMELRYAGESASREAIVDRLEQAVRLDPSNERAGRMLERLYRRDERWDEVARVLERVADRAESAQGRIGAGVRLARLYRHKLDDQERTARAYQVVLREVPEHREAMEYLSEFFSNAERWDDLVQLYERQLDKADLAERLGDVLQVAMLHWRKREKPQDAEVWFDKIRKIEPGHPLMLNFYREYAKEFDDSARLVEALQGAQRAMPDGPEKAAVAAELARLSEGQANAHRAIEQYKGVLRHDPDNHEARDALKRLYKQTQGYNALVELLRQQLERTPHESYEERLAILREVATVYRQYIKSDTALVSVLNQIVQLDDKLDEHDVEEVRELVALYEKLSRWRDLLTHQLKLAQITPDRDEKKGLYRAAARRWLEQFSNVQNATEAYEALLELEPDDREARERLEELYKKRRAWPALYNLYQKELENAEGAQRLTLLRDMAQLAAERLNRPADAMTLYKSILETDPSRREVLDALEKFAERAKDWATLAEALERRVDITEDDQGKLATLQKLGSVYADQLQNPHSAATAWRRVLELQPGHPRALRVLRESYLAAGEYDELEQLYGLQGDWEGLAEVFSTAADRAKDAAQKIALSYRAANVYEEKLAQPERAFRSYERILATDPTDARAAAALVPLYERDEKWARLPPLYELLQQATEDEDEKLELLRKLTSVTGQRLGDRKAAVDFARRAYELSPSNEVALDLFRQAAREANAWEPFVQALEARLTSASTPPSSSPKKRRKGKRAEPEPASGGGLSPEEQRTLELELAHVYVDQLGRIDEGIGAYKRLLSHEPGDRDAAAALEGILRREDRRDDLRWLLELRVQHAASDEERTEILAEWATLEEDVFDSKEQAIAIHRRMLALDPTHDAALRALPRLLLEAGDAAGAAEVLERHRDLLSGAERSAREADVAELYLSRLNRPQDALEAGIRALEEAEQAPRAMRVLEQLLEEPSVAARAAEVLAAQYATGGDARREVQALAVMLKQTEDRGDKMALYSRLADVYEEKLSAFSSALDVVLHALDDFPRELSLWDRADSLAVLAGRPTDLADKLRDVLHAGKLPPDIESELCERAAKLHEERLGDPIGATPYLERVLDLDPSNDRAFRRLKDILTAAERWSELEGLYDKASRATDDPARRTDMLVEVALICEEIIEDVAKATSYYERILAVDPAHDTAIRALDRLYGVQERNQDLAALLERRLEMAAGDEIFELKLRIARLQLEKLHHPEGAIDHVEDVLRERVNDYAARELAEKLLAIGALRGRAARMLETVYEARDEIRDLVRVLEIRLEVLDTAGEQADSDERRELLRRIARLRDERMRDDPGALDVLSKLVPADPLDTDARERLLEIGRRMGAHERVAEVLSLAAERSGSPGMQGEILMQVARIYEDLLGDMERAEAAYRRVLAIDETDADLVLPAARALERIYIGQGAHEKLAEVLRIQVKLEQEGDARRQLLGRLGEISQSVLGDTSGAIDAWRARAEDNPTDEAALAALDRLYEETERWQDLVDVIERRKEVTDAPAARRALMTRAAETLAGRLGKTSEAIDAWVGVVEEFGPDIAALEALERLYGQAQRWEELAETYEQHLDVADTDEKRLELLAKLGDIRRQHLSDLESSLDAYRRALTIDTTHAPSRAALEVLLDAEDVTTRREAASILHPIYETDGDNERLLRVLEIEVETAEDPEAKLDGLHAALRVAEGPLDDASRAFSYAERGVRAAVGHTELTPWLDHLERLAQATGRQAAYVKLLTEVVPEIFDGDVQLAVTLKIADLARHRLADRELAREYYQKALELRADEKRALSALESLYEEAGDPQNLLEVLERRVEGAETDQERKQLLFRRARLLGDVVGDKQRAVEVYETILDIDLDPAAISALETLYPEIGQYAQLATLYERQLDHGVGDAADLHVRIARVAARELGDVSRAFDELDRALDTNRQNAEAIAELERLLKEAPEPEQRGRAASLLEPVYLVRADYGKVMQCIRARLDASTEPDERRDLLSRLAQLYEEQQENYDAALETTAKLFHDDLSNQATLAELERLAKVAGAERRLAEIFAGELEQLSGDDETTATLAHRTGELFDQLGELDKALSFYRRALAFEPDSRRLFQAIDGILERTARHEERIDLYREALDHRFEAPERLEVLHTIARLQREELGRVDEAIETYRAALDVDESDKKSLDALTELYRQRERWEDLSELYLRRAESAPSAEEAAKHRLDLARLLKNEMRDTERSLDQLEEIVRSVPTHTQAVQELEALREQDAYKERVVEILRPIYESADDWRHLIKLNEDRFQLAGDPAEKVGVLRETARLWEERGNDKGRARRALAEAFKIDPDDADVRSDYERLVEQTRAWDQLTETYEEALNERPDVVSKRDILAVLARVHDEKRDDPRRALNAYDRLRAVDEGDLEPLNKMETLSMLLSDWPTLVRVQTAKADLLLDDMERASVWRRAGEVKRDMLEDSPGAIEAFEHALELEPESASTIDRLIDLYEQKGEAQRLAELYEQRVEIAAPEEEELKYQLLQRAAAVYEEKLADRPRAIETLGRALAGRPGDPELLEGLNRLYRAEQMWPELLDNLRLQASATEDADTRSSLRKQIGSILADKLESYEEALEAYRLVLDETPGDADTVAAVRKIGDDHPDLRLQVADILVPVLRQSERFEDLVGVLEMRLTSQTDPSDRAETLRTIAENFEGRLGRPGDALEALLRALTERPDAMDLHADIERLARFADGFAKYVDALSERAQSTFEPEVTKDLYTRIGRIAEDELKDDRRAVEAYQKALEQSGDQPELLEALDRLYSRLGDAQALHDVLERRVELESEEAKQGELLYRMAVVQIRDFAEPGRGLGSLRMALERAPEHENAILELEKLTDQRDLFDEAAEVLEGVYRSRGRTDRLATLYEKRVGFADSPGERIDMRRNLARVLEEEGGDASAAQRVLQQGLVDDPNDSSLLGEIERLAAITGNWEGAAAALRSAIDSKAELLPEQAAQLCVRVAGWQRDKMEDNAAAEQSLRKALEYEPNNDEILTELEALQRAPGREKDLVETLRRRAKLQLGDDRREELYRQAKDLAQSQNDAELAESVLRELLSHDDANLWALAELTTLREAAGDYKETFELLVKRSELRAQGEAVRELRKNAAQIARDKLGDRERAIGLYEQLFEDDPNDTEAAAALRELYQAAERWTDLGRLLERLVDLADTPSARSVLRLELARLNQEQFKASDTAIELLRVVLEEEPGQSEAVVALSELYEQTDRDEELAELLSNQIQAARDRADTQAELTFLVRLAEVYESRLSDRKKAAETYASVLERDPQHRGALESLARLQETQGDFAEAARTIERLLELASGQEKLALSSKLADLYAKLGDNENAARALERGLEADERNAEVRARLQKLYESTSAWDRLASHLARDADFSDDVDEKVKLLVKAAGIQSGKRSDHAAAAELLDKASQIRPDDRELLLQLCDEYSASGRGKAAAEVLEKIVESYGGKRTKELGEIHRRLANAYLADGETQRALDELDKAFRIEPGNINVLKRLGEVAIEVGDMKKAQQMFRALLLQKLDDSSPITKAEVFMRLGEVHEKLDEKSKAIQMYERAVQADDSLEQAKVRLVALKK